MTADRDRARWTSDSVAGEGEALAIALTLGHELNGALKRRRMTQRQLARRVGLTQSRISQILRGRGASAPLETWVKLGIAVGRPLAVRLSRDIEQPEPRDAGHMAAQELVAGLARRHGRRTNVELATKPWDPSQSADTLLVDDRKRVLLLIEIVNRAGDIGAGFRAGDRKAAELERLAILAGGDDGAYRVAIGWLLVDSAANRNLVRRYPEVLRSRFPGSSAGLAKALMEGREPPVKPAVAWIDVRAGQIRPLRLRT
ncbi:MAG: helix-turn-helix domain-containing protein [Chloroflexi bacterium]|nr:helix-turn-helix domain-containing protein [Chloroflexota bacterium]